MRLNDPREERPLGHNDRWASTQRPRPMGDALTGSIG